MASIYCLASVTLPDAIEIGHYLGLLLVAVAFLAWHDRKSEIRITERLDRLERELDGTLKDGHLA